MINEDILKLIHAEKVCLERQESKKCSYPKDCGSCALSCSKEQILDCCDSIKKLVEETRKTARWLEISMDPDGFIFNFKCSNCKNEESAINKVRIYEENPFCRKCGFRMTTADKTNLRLKK